MKKIIAMAVACLVLVAGSAFAKEVVFKKEKNAFMVKMKQGSTVLVLHALYTPTITSYHLVRSEHAYDLTVITSELELGVEELAAGYQQYVITGLSDKEANRALEVLENVFSSRGGN